MSIESIFNIDPETIDYNDQNEVKKNIQMLLNILEMLSKENLELRKGNQELKDVINQLKGEQGKPNIKPKTNNDISAPKQKNPGKKKRGKKKALRKTISG